MKPALTLILAACAWAGMAALPAAADHDMVYGNCDPADTRASEHAVWYIDYETGVALRYDDPFWAEQASPMVSWISNYQYQCQLGATGVWQAIGLEPLAHPPNHVTDTRPPRTTTTTTTVPPTTTTTTLVDECDTL